MVGESGVDNDDVTLATVDVAGSKATKVKKQKKKSDKNVKGQKDASNGGSDNVVTLPTDSENEGENLPEKPITSKKKSKKVKDARNKVRNATSTFNAAKQREKGTISSKKKKKGKLVEIKESPVVFTYNGIDTSNDGTNNEVTSPNDINNNEVTSPNDINNNEVTSPNDVDSLEDTSPNPLSSAKNPTPKKPAFKKPAKPHIIFVIADDLGYNDIGYHTRGTGSVVDTPIINDLALSGVRLENYYVQPVCTPTRASLMTGRYPIRMGLQHGNIRQADPNCLPLDETTLPDKLRDLGYATHAVGKWHLGFSSPKCLPTQRGFDSYLGLIIGSAGHYNYTKKGRALYSNESVEWNHTGKYSTELYTEHAVDIIRKHDRSVPLFLYLSYQAVHSPIECPDVYQRRYKDKYPDLWRVESRSLSGRLKYLGLLESVDVGLGNLTQVLKNTRMWEDTVLVFTSDNGGRNNLFASNWPLRGEKNTLFEGGIKGSAFVSSPLLPPDVIGTVQTGLMHVSDWFPTLVEGVAGGVAETRLPLDGLNMWPTIAEGLPSPRWEILHNIDHMKYMRRPDKPLPPTPYPHNQWILYDYIPFYPRTYAAIRYDNWKLITGIENIEYSGWVPPEESFKQPIPMETVDNLGIYVRLYDITKDPEERDNIALSNRHIVFKLLHRLAHHNEHVVIPEHLYNDPAAIRAKETPEGISWNPWRS
ncbi:arylsulfatase B-like [Amphiura filiformis]|uniref:arylsulfatase B-like n=1 Tax=Amphiura filiformis TaxID=82378 RepID=UPI003B221F66